MSDKLLTIEEEKVLRKKHYDLVNLYQQGSIEVKDEILEIQKILEVDEYSKMSPEERKNKKHFDNMSKMFSKLDELHSKMKMNNDDLEKKLGERKKKIEDNYKNPTNKVEKVDKDMER